LESFHRRNPDGPIIVALTGTDLYRDIHSSRQAKRALEIADRLIVLQCRGADEIRPALREKVRVIYQSAAPMPFVRRRAARTFDVCVLGHLRPEKDPFRAARALRYLPTERPFRVVQVGAALSQRYADQARAWEKADQRYRWLGDVSAKRARRILAASSVLVVSSRMEGGANVISEALADEVPILASRIPGNIGLLGDDYPGYFNVGETRGLADLLCRMEMAWDFHAELRKHCLKRMPLIDPARERRSWQALLRELTKGR
jgi:putative glycosyltransferase (TIGR04348 family)